MQKLPLALITCFIFAFTVNTALSACVTSGGQLYKSCVSCHNADASKHGLNKLSEEDFVKNLIRIRDDTSQKYQPMKKIFKTYSEDDIANIAAYVQTLKSHM